jgi:hypothetical protein
MRTQEEINRILANQAVLYSQSIIKKGSTQTENNSLPLEKYDALYDGVKDNRELIRKSVLPNVAIDLIPNKLLNLYEKFTAISAKSSLGNCFEMALHAFDYLLYHPAAVDINFKIFEIKGGDHVFVVIGLKESDSNDPSTWGKDVFFIDPWNAKKQVYPASEFHKNLKSWRREIIKDSDGKLVSVKNALDDFDEKKHTLETGKKLHVDAAQIRQLRKENIDLVKQNFLTEAKSVLSLLSKLEFKLNRCNFVNNHLIISPYVEKIHLAKQNLYSGINSITAHRIHQEFRALNHQLTHELEAANQLLYPPIEIFTILEKYDKIASNSRYRLFTSSKVEPPIEPEPTLSPQVK